MKKSISFLTMAALLASAGIANAQSSATATANASVNVIHPISIVKDADLNFGSVVPSSTPGVVSITGQDPTVRTNTGGTYLVNDANTPGAAKFEITGEANFSFLVSTPIGITLTGPGAPITVYLGHPAYGASLLVETSPGPNLNGWTTTFPVTPNPSSRTFYLGGTLHVNANQVPGVYSTSFVATVQYN